MGRAAPAQEAPSRWTRPNPPGVTPAEVVDPGIPSPPPLYLLPLDDHRTTRELLRRAERMATVRGFRVVGVDSAEEIRATESPGDIFRVIWVGHDQFWSQDTDLQGLNEPIAPHTRQVILLDDKTSFRLREAGFGPEESPPSSLDPARLRTVSPTVRESDLVDWLDWIWTTRNQREGRAILEVAVSDSMVPTVDRALARSSFAGEVIWLNHEGTRRGQGRGMAEGSPEAEALLRWNLGILMGQVTSTERLEEFRQRPLVTDFSQIPRLGGGSGSESPPAPRLSR